jgi:two-component system, NtrC family, response regulator GlrR
VSLWKAASYAISTRLSFLTIRGTLFLDEIDALSTPAQIKLLRFLQDGEYRPLGSPHSTLSNVRLVAATNANLRKKVEDMVLRDDLYHRLNVLRLSLPPLRERIEDIALLTRHFLAKYGGPSGRNCLRLSHGALQKLMAYSWPGNIRELEGVIQRTVVLSASAIFHACDIDLPVPYDLNAKAACCLREAKSRVVEQFERSYLISLLAAHLGNVSQAAKAAGKERRDFQRLLRKHHLQRTDPPLAS